jgi:hypothetical protein
MQPGAILATCLCGSLDSESQHNDVVVLKIEGTGSAVKAMWVSVNAQNIKRERRHNVRIV